MNPNEGSENEEQLRGVLGEWVVNRPLPAHFQDQVWQRIELSEARQAARPYPWAGFAHWIGSVFTRPTVAVPYIGVLLIIGSAAGWAQARKQTAHVKGDLGLRYVRVLDPYQAPRE
jgi:hypothetical protein